MTLHTWFRAAYQTALARRALFMLLLCAPALLMAGSARAQNNDWYVTRTPLTEVVDGVKSTIGLIVTVESASRGVNFTYTDIYSGNCTAYIAIGFTHPGNQTGTCILSGPNALVEATAQLPRCQSSYEPSTWSSSCILDPVCPEPGNNGGGYNCGTSQRCNCPARSQVGNGLTTICSYSDNGLGTYECGSERRCGCSPQNSAAATAPYCLETPGANPCIPTPNSTSIAPESLTSQYTVPIEQQMDTLATNNQSVAPPALQQAIDGLSNQTNGCLNNN